MSTSCQGSLAKLLLAVLNVLFLMASLGMVFIAFRGRMAQDGPTYGTDKDVAIVDLFTCQEMATSITLLGSVILLVSIVGLFGVLCESQALLKFYMYLLTLSACAVIGLNVFGWLFTEEIITKGSGYYNKLRTNHSGHPKAAYLLDKIQSIGQCCGELDPTDWQNGNLTWAQRTIDQEHFPKSCCGAKQSNSTTSDLCDARNLLYHDGCFSPVQINRYEVLAQAMFLLVTGFLIILLTISCCLERDVRLQNSHLINIQYAAHLTVCRGQNVAPLSGTHSRARTDELYGGGYRGEPIEPRGPYSHRHAAGSHTRDWSTGFERRPQRAYI